uniref:IS66 family transposase n=2 Tax=Sphingomonas panni TaxID=237612 RepID=UPI001F5B7F73
AADDRASGSTAPRATWYRFTPDRTAAHPLSHLAGFRGFLQADAYAGYDGLYRSGVTEVACWAHFRRKVFDLHERSPTPLTTDILKWIGTLYTVEAEVRGQPPDVRCRTRQEKSRLLVDDLRAVLDAALRRLSPRSDMARAIAYGTKRWPALSRFLDDGRLEIDNNIAERALRGVAVGRRNWLFAGSRAGGERAAAIYTVIQTCKANGVDPQTYIADVIAKVAADWPASRWDELMPWNWMPPADQPIAQAA